MLFDRISLLFAVQLWSELTYAQLYQNATYGQTVTYGNNTYAETYLKPTAQGTTWYWSQAITPAILGTVFVVINDHNQTITTTSTNSAAVANNTQYLKNGTLSLLTRTDVNLQGTVTDVVPTGGDGSMVLAYPTPYFTVVSPVSWEGLFPDLQSGVTCCNSNKATSSAVPQNHYSFPSMTGSTNSADPRGWLYLMATSQLATFSGSQNISSLFAPATISSVKQHCPHYLCAAASSALGAEGVQMVGALLETSTVHVTGSFSGSASPAATSKQTEETSKASVKSSVEANPVSTTRSSSTPQTTKPAVTAIEQVSNAVKVTNNPAPPASETTAENIGVALGQLLDTTVPSGVDTTTATKEGATGVQAESQLLTIDSNFNIIPPKTTTTQPASKIQEQLPKSTLSSTTANIGDPIGSLLGSGASNDNNRVQNTVNPESPRVAVGSTSLALQSTQLATTVSGVSTNVDAVVIGSQTIAVGASDSVGSVPVAVVTAGSQTAVIVGGSETHVLPQATREQDAMTRPLPTTRSSITGSVLRDLPTITPRPTLPPIVVGSSTIPANDFDQYVVADQTLKIGSAITVGNTPIALQTDGSTGLVLVVGTSSSALHVLPEPSEEAAPIVVGSSTISQNSGSAYVVGGQTLKPGSSITLGSGSAASVLELKTSGSDTILVMGTSSSTLQQQSTEVLTVGTAKITPIESSEYLVGSQTLVPGASAITVSGVRYSLASDGGNIVAGSSTQALTSEIDIGGYIWSALGGSSTGGSTSSSPGASAARDSTSSSTTGGTAQASATPTEEGGIGDILRPFRRWTLVLGLLWATRGL